MFNRDNNLLTSEYTVTVGLSRTEDEGIVRHPRGTAKSRHSIALGGSGGHCGT